MITDRSLGQPIPTLLLMGRILLPFAAIGLLLTRFVPHPCREFISISCFVVLAACIVLSTPYLMLAELCFYAMSRLPFPKSLAVGAWLNHAMLLAAVAVCLWRTWVLWPAYLAKKKPSSARKVSAPWWGYVLGGMAVLGLSTVMAYFFHFQD